MLVTTSATKTDGLSSKQTPEGTLTYTYDAAGGVLSIKSSNTGGASDAYTYDVLNRLSTVTDTSGATNYAYDSVGNLQSFAYPNGVTHAYTYDPLNRLTQMGAAKNSTAISNYAYTLGAAGNRLTVAELGGRNVLYGYDSLYRLTSEAIAADPANHNGTTQYTYDAVGNRKQLIVNGTTANIYSYDADDRLGSDQYDPNGNTTLSLGVGSSYDFENHLVQKGAVTIVYDGDGNRVSETVGGVTTNYLIDTQNPTGYAQVVDELQNGAVTRTYSYGLERISETQALGTSFYGYDGHGSVRQLTNAAGALTDSYDYDAFGNLINQTGSTPNNYLFAGEQYDTALNLYYNRARCLNTSTGRFINMDRHEGNDESPLSLHKYLYAGSNPVDRVDPSGREFDLTSFTIGSAVAITLAGIGVGYAYTRTLQGAVSGGEGGALLGLSLVVGDPRLRVRTFAGAFTNAAWQYFANLYSNYVADTLGQPEKPEQEERELVVEAFAAGAAGGYGSYLFQDVLFPGSDYAAGFSGVFNAMETAFAQGKCVKDACVSAAISFITAFGSSYTGATNAFDPAGPVIKQLINTAFTKTFSTFAKPTLINFLKSIGADNLVDSLSCP